MKRGDLVEYYDPNSLWDWDDWRGVIVKQIPGTDNIQVVYWYNNSQKQSCKAKNLKVINEAR
jgi:hypothetical protein